MNPDDIPRTWVLRLACSSCGLPIVYPSKDCRQCSLRIEEALRVLNTVKPVPFPPTEDAT